VHSCGVQSSAGTTENGAIAAQTRLARGAVHGTSPDQNS
jgi:hypothetical protein